jgi:hypothetical protein
MNRKRRQYGNGKSLGVVLFCLIAAVNASQGIVLCSGSYGHVAIEPVDHSHCDHAAHHHDFDPEPCDDKEAQYSGTEGCGRCVDIALPIGPLDGRALSDGLKAIAAAVVGESSAARQNLLVLDAGSEEVPLPAFHDPLRSIVLQV